MRNREEEFILEEKEKLILKRLENFLRFLAEEVIIYNLDKQLVYKFVNLYIIDKIKVAKEEDSGKLKFKIKT